MTGFALPLLQSSRRLLLIEYGSIGHGHGQLNELQSDILEVCNQRENRK